MVFERHRTHQDSERFVERRAKEGATEREQESNRRVQRGRMSAEVGVGGGLKQ